MAEFIAILLFIGIPILLVYIFIYMPIRAFIRWLKQTGDESVAEVVHNPSVRVEIKPSTTLPPVPAPKQQHQAEKPPRIYTLQEVTRWEQDGGIWTCVCHIPQESSLRYLRCNVRSSEYDGIVEAGTFDLLEFDVNDKRRNFTAEHLEIPQRGVLNIHTLFDMFFCAHILDNDRILSVDTNSDSIAEYIAEQEREAEEKKRKALEREKAEIAAKIKERQRKRDLEKQVRQEMLDSGELYGEQTKRPPIPREVVDAVYKRDGGRCVYCGSVENLHLDHIIPFSRGGATNVENLQLLCQKCNLEKSNKIG